MASKKKHKIPAAPEPSGGALFPHFGDAGFWIIAGLVLTVFLRPLVSGVSYPWSNTWFQIIVIVLFSFLAVRVIRGGVRFYRGPAGIAAACLLLWTGVSSVFSVYPAASLRELYNVCGYVLFFFLVVNLLRSDRKREAALNALFASTAIVSVYAVYQYYWGLDKTRLLVEMYHAGEFVPEFIKRLGTQRAFSTFVYPPALAGFLTVVLPAAFAMFLREKEKIKKYALLAVCFLSAFALVLTYSKGGWITLAASAVFFALIWMKYVRKRLHRGAVIGVLALGLALAGAVFSGVEGRATARGFIVSYLVRYEYWLAAPGIISEYPLFGSGPGTWGAVYPEYKLLEAEETQMAHNNFVQAAAETGPAGLIIFVWFFGAVMLAGFRRLRAGEGSAGEKLLAAGALTGVFAFLFQSLGEFTFYIPGVAVAVFLLSGILCSVRAGEGSAGPASSGRKLLYSALVVAVAVMLIVFFRKPMAGDRYYEKSLELAGEGRVIAAGIMLDRAIESFPAEARYYYRKGMVYESRPGFLEEAVGFYQKAVRLNPMSSAAHSRLAHACWRLSGGEDNEYRDKALYHMEQAVSRYPFAPLYRVSLGRMYHLSGKERSAAEQYRKAIEYESGERMTLRRERLLEQLEDVKRWLEEIEESL